MDVRVGHKEGWAVKDWCFQIVVLEKALESSLDSEEIKPVNPKANSPDYSLEVELATWCKELTRWKRPWCWEKLKGSEEGGNRG